MLTGVDEEVERLGAVMDGVKSPQKRNLMGQPMAPVVADLANTIAAQARSQSGHAMIVQITLIGITWRATSAIADNGVARTKATTRLFKK